MTYSLALKLCRIDVKYLICFLIFCIPPAFSDTLITTKQRFTMENYETHYGEIIPNVEIGWESYGTLNVKKDNVILITHFFSGTSHAAGKYSEDDKASGYWDSIIGPGKSIDTNKYYVISSDTLINANVKSPNVYTTGPSSIDPKTNKPYGLTFPIVTIRDFVNVQHALLASLSIKKLHAVVGASMGSFQALEWASAYPEMVPRAIAVVTAGEADSYLIAEVEKWANYIKADPLWNNGDYYGKEEPLDGLTNAIFSINLIGVSGLILDRQHKKRMTDEMSPRKSIRSNFSIYEKMEVKARAKARRLDANSVLYLVRANQLYRLGHARTVEEGIRPIKAKILLLPSKYDVLIPEYTTQSLYTKLLMQNKSVIYDEIRGPWGHVDAILAIGTKKNAIRDFLDDK